MPVFSESTTIFHFESKESSIINIRTKVSLMSTCIYVSQNIFMCSLCLGICYVLCTLFSIYQHF